MHNKFLGLTLVAFIGLAGCGEGDSDSSMGAAEPMAEEMGVMIPESHPLYGDIQSGLNFRDERTQAMQADDFENPAFTIWDIGEEEWNTTAGEAGKSCASCHGEDATSVKRVASEYPVYDEGLGKLINVEQQINRCRTEQMQAEPYKWESPEMLGMTAYVKSFGRGDPVNVAIDGPAEPFFKAGEAFYYQRRGQLDMSCAHCHEANYGMRVRADLLSQGQSNGFPTYRFKWQGVGSLHRRFRGCNQNIRGERLGYGADEYVNLELYLAWRGQGLPVESPSVRN